MSSCENAIGNEREVLNKLMPEYVSLYRIDLNTGKYEILRLASNTNARLIADNDPHPFENFDAYTIRYANAFIPADEQADFLTWHFCRNMKKRFHHTEKQTYHYHSVSKEGKDSYYEALAVKENCDQGHFTILLGYRNIDSILYREKDVQEKLRHALEEARLNNEIISAIAKTYQYISRIDIEADWYEEIANRDRRNLKFLKNGVVSEGNKKACRNFVAEEYQEAFFLFTDIKTLPERMRHEETIALEYRMKDGNWHKLRFIEKKRDADGNLTHVLCAIRSISDEKKREQILLHQIAEAKSEAKLKTRFLSNMSHDIRTPMNGIIGMIELADRYPDDPDMQKRCRDKVLESSKSLLSMINDILDMNKLESGDYTDQEIRFDLAKLLSRANIGSQAQAEKKQIQYVVDWGKGGLKHRYLIGNPVYVERILTILADNAIKFTNPGGIIHVWCMEKEADETQVVYEFRCADSGVGMSENFIEHAFDLFSQENESSRTKYEGTGLGLAIAKKITEHLGGRIRLESTKGQGTTAIVTIPFKIGEQEEEKQEEAKKAEDAEEISLEGKRALVAEDNEINREILTYMLEDHGILTECAVDGMEVVEKFEQSSEGYYDIIFMDIRMPNMNGWDAARKIRAMRRRDAETIPMIAISANTFAEDMIRSRISGMDEHLAKPLDETKLLSAMRRCITQKK